MLHRKYFGGAGIAMKIAKVFRSGNSQAVRLPKEFRVSDDEVFIKRTGGSSC